MCFRLPLCRECAPAVPSPATTSCSPCRYVAHPRRYGSAAGLTVSSCTANCSAGYACPAGSTSPIAQLCPAGTFSGVGAAVCSPCPGGSYGATQAMAAPTCTGPCTAGYACPAGSVSPTALLCAPGQYSFAGAAVCSPCPAGQFGSSVGLTVDTCSGLCPSGRCVARCVARAYRALPRRLPCSDVGIFPVVSATQHAIACMCVPCQIRRRSWAVVQPVCRSM